MRFGSVCSGIEAASVAWEPLGWACAWVSEIDPFANAVLAHRYPGVPNLGDFTRIGRETDGTSAPAVDLLVGGTPCQDYSVAGERAGMAGDDGRLALEYVALLGRLRPRWLVWENVPGVLSSNDGRDFGAFLGGLAELGYGFAYRVLDAQHFGVPQRRRRVFVVGHLGDWRPPAAVLFERASLSGHPPPRREAGTVAPAGPLGCADGGGGLARALSTRVEPFDPSAETLVLGLAENQQGELHLTPYIRNMTSGGGKPGQGYPAMIAFSYIDDGRDATTELVPTLRVGTTLAHGKSAGGVGGNAAVAYAPKPLHYTHDYNQDRVYDPEGVAPAVCAQDSAGARQELTGTTVRRLTPRECERLQGFQDDWTLVPYRGR